MANRAALQAFDDRIGLSAWWESPRGVQHAQGMPTQMNGDVISRGLRTAETFWISSDMMQVVGAAWPTLPLSPLHATEAPATDGFVLFGEPIRSTEDDSVAYRGLSWFTEQRPPLTPDQREKIEEKKRNLEDDEVVLYDNVAFDSNPSTWLVIIGYMDWTEAFGFLDVARQMDGGIPELRRRFGGPPLCPGLTDQCPYGHEPEGSTRMIQLVRTIWFLTQQRIASVHRESGSRADARRAARNGIEHIPEVAVVTLRRPAGKPREDGDGPGFVDWSHRWIVGGHWRQQWVPSEKLHRPTWIAPYVKGPEDKPLVADRVYQLVR